MGHSPLSMTLTVRKTRTGWSISVRITLYRK